MIGYGYEQQDEYDMAAEEWARKAHEARQRSAWQHFHEECEREQRQAVIQTAMRGYTWMPSRRAAPSHS